MIHEERLAEPVFWALARPALMLHSNNFPKINSPPARPQVVVSALNTIY
jgi:hypothetical protein